MPSRPFVTCSALALFAVGVVLLFDPASLGVMTPPATLIVALYAAAVIGLALATWTGRAGPIGGIYGRALTMGNFGHAFIGALSLVRPVLAGRGSGEGAGLWWGALALYAVLAIGWGYLLFWSSGLQRDPSRDASLSP